MSAVMGKARMVPLTQLRPAEWNANRVKPSTLAKVRRSIEEFGFVENLVARPHPTEDGALEVLSGNHRFELLLEMGVEKAPVVVVEIGDARARVLAQTLNRTRGEDDPEAYARLLEAVLGELTAAEVVEFLPESESSIERALRSLSAPSGDLDEAPAVPDVPVSRVGEVVELGEHRLVCGDVRDPDAWDALLAGDTADLCVTDPPYGVRYQGGAQAFSAANGKRRIRTIEGDESAELYAATLPLLADVLRPDGALYLWFSDSRAREVLEDLRVAGFRQRCVIVWVKDVPTGALTAQYIPRHEPLVYASTGPRAPRWFGPTNETTIWEHPKPRTNDLHPTQKPVALYERAILNSSRAGEIVLDPFAGSGTALVAAEQTGRRARVMEKDPGYCDVIRERWERTLLGQAA